MNIILPLLAVVDASNAVGLLINILIVVLIFSLAFWVIAKMGVPEPVNLVLRVIVGVIALLWLLSMVGAFGGHPFLVWHG